MTKVISNRPLPGGEDIYFLKENQHTYVVGFLLTPAFKLGQAIKAKLALAMTCVPLIVDSIRAEAKNI